MKKELDALLCERYPKIFAARNGKPTETAMCWGFECGDGWFNLIDSGCRVIQWHLDWHEKTCKDHPEYGVKEIPQVVAIQVKEKYGTLRFYISGGDDFVSGVVSMMENMSEHVCEECGAPGKVRSKGWVRTLCDSHAKELGHEEEE